MQSTLTIQNDPRTARVEIVMTLKVSVTKNQFFFIISVAGDWSSGNTITRPVLSSHLLGIR